MKQFKQPIYPCNLYIAITDNPDSASSRFHDYETGQVLYFNDFMNYNAITHRVINKRSEFGILIIFRDKKSMTCATIAHEASHAAKFMFDYVGADARVHEPFEYLLGWIAKCCDEMKNPKKKKVKKIKNENTTISE